MRVWMPTSSGSVCPIERLRQRRASLLNRLLDTSHFVGWQIIHHDDIALAQSRSKKMFDIGQETRAVHRSIKHARGSDFIISQGPDEGRRHPMTVRRKSLEALSTRSPAIEPHHIGLCSSFINEDKMFRVQIGLARMPFFAGFGDIHAVLFGSTQ